MLFCLLDRPITANRRPRCPSSRASAITPTRTHRRKDENHQVLLSTTRQPFSAPRLAHARPTQGRRHGRQTQISLCTASLKQRKHPLQPPASSSPSRQQERAGLGEGSSLNGTSSKSISSSGDVSLVCAACPAPRNREHRTNPSRMERENSIRDTAI